MKTLYSRYLFPAALSLVLVPGLVCAADLIINDCAGVVRAVRVVETGEVRSVQAKIGGASLAPVRISLTAVEEQAQREGIQSGSEVRFNNVSPGIWRLCADAEGVEISDIVIGDGERVAAGKTLITSVVAGAVAAGGFAISRSDDSSNEQGTAAFSSTGSAVTVNDESTNSDGSSSNWTPEGVDLNHPCLQTAGQTNSAPCYIEDRPPPISPFS